MTSGVVDDLACTVLVGIRATTIEYWGSTLPPEEEDRGRTRSSSGGGPNYGDNLDYDGSGRNRRPALLPLADRYLPSFLLILIFLFSELIKII
ncbi:hypothetical protein CRG98_016781 [Punica granatum]|uniref:Uncharacterized protein n=1 Tax=Punica granatum TaxID=22663 RepID=A0A2I0K3W8_PUNGR|nr:hypothetical protein CRG98_016781 [Punica granatum]